MDKADFKPMTMQNVVRPLWKHYLDMYYVVDGLLSQAMWFFSQGCYSADSYWTALSMDPGLQAWADASVTYDQGSFAKVLCANWQLCE